MREIYMRKPTKFKPQKYAIGRLFFIWNGSLVQLADTLDISIPYLKNLRDGSRRGSKKMIEQAKRNSSILKFENLKMPEFADMIRDLYLTVSEHELDKFYNKLHKVLKRLENDPLDWAHASLIQGVVLFQLGRLNDSKKVLNDVIDISIKLDLHTLAAVAELNTINLQWEIDDKQGKSLAYKEYAAEYRRIDRTLQSVETALNTLKASFRSNNSLEYSFDFYTLLDRMPKNKDPQEIYYICENDDDLCHGFVNTDVFKSWWNSVTPEEKNE